MRPTLMASMLLAMAGVATADQPQAIQWDFEDATVGTVPAGWSSAKTGDQIECHLNGKKQLEAKDDTLTKPGKVGLWTKADAQTSFDNLTVSEVGK